MVGASQRLADRQIPSEFGSALKIKRRGGMLLGEHRGWMLHMAFSYKAKILCTTACFPVSPQRGINYPPPAFGWRSTLSLQKGKRTVFFPLISFRILADSHLLLTFFPHCCLFCTALHVLLIYYYFSYPNKVDSTFHHSLKRTVPLSLQNGKRYAYFR